MTSCYRGSVKTILVVDDDDDLREVMVHILTRAGYRVVQATNGLEALAGLESVDALPDLVLLDLMMPFVAGDAVLKALRASRATVTLPVVVLSAIADRCKPAGADGYLQKPMSGPELLAAVRTFVAA